MPEQYKCWIITGHSPSTVDRVKVKELFDYAETGAKLSRHDNTIKYVKFGVEFNRQGERMHYQGFIIFDKKMTMTAAKSYGPSTWHWQKAGSRNTDMKNIADYIGRTEKQEKDANGNVIDSYVQPLNYVMCEAGAAPMHPGQAGAEAVRCEYAEARRLAVEGRMMDIDAGVMVRNYNNLKRIRDDYREPAEDLEDVAGIWIWGPPGTGKSHHARKFSDSIYVKSYEKWWCGYDGEEVALLEDLDPIVIRSQDGKHLAYSLKIWADKFAFSAAYKGGRMHMRPKHFIVTSNFSIDYLFADVPPQTLHAISRRFRIINLVGRVDSLGELPEPGMSRIVGEPAPPAALPAPIAPNPDVIDLVSDEEEVLPVNLTPRYPVPPNNVW